MALLPNNVGTRIVVLGVGNVLLSDEGVGPQVIGELDQGFEFPPQTMLIDGGTSAMELLDDMAKADLLLIVDAVHSGQEPGSVIKLTGEQVPRFFTTKLSPHQVGISDVLATLSLTGETPAETIIIGVEPASLRMGMQLSPVVVAAIPLVIDELFDELRRRGIEPKPRVAAAAASV